MAFIRALGYLAEYIGGRSMKIRVDKPVKIRDIIKLPLDLEGRIIILVNGQPSTLDSLIVDSDRIVLMPIISGG
ncbi:MAG: MoaD/ThiS family protein [archaeon GB-1867-097]|nr:MoaD/ThiS family protein [Candidatus Culexmicrobium thermophilum]MCS7384709.1 MoaD/ThiS family protein [Candidatus Culexmicrobium thermophilum]HDO20235.1 hypothetical protein [Candidatus Bathyarchaeota archaeon]